MKLQEYSGSAEGIFLGPTRVSKHSRFAAVGSFWSTAFTVNTAW